MIFNQTLFLACNKIYFNLNLTPVHNRALGINFFSSNIDTIKRLYNAIWFGNVISNNERLDYSIHIADNITVLTSMEKLGNLFALSLFHRCFSVLSSSAKLYIDNSKFAAKYKYTALFILSALPSLFLIYAMGYPPEELIINALFQQTISAAVSYCSFKVGNALRSLDLISDTKKFDKKAYISKILLSTAIDLAFTLAWHGQAFYHDPFRVQDTYHAIYYCMNIPLKNGDLVSTVTYSSSSFMSFVDKGVWLLGRLAFDAALYFAHNIGLVKDIRSPFMTAFPPKKIDKKTFIEKHIIIKPTHHHQSKHNNKKIREYIAEIQENQLNYDNLYHSYSDNQLEEIAYKKPKVKTHKPSQYPQNSVPNTPASSATKSSQVLKIGDYTFYKLAGEQVSDNTWGVIGLKKKYDVSQFIPALRSGHVGNQHSAICLKQHGVFAIRPKSNGDRLLGKIYKGRAALDNLFFLGEAMSALTEFFKKDKDGNDIEPTIIIFDQWCKHDDIKKTINSMGR